MHYTCMQCNSAGEVSAGVGGVGGAGGADGAGNAAAVRVTVRAPGAAGTLQAHHAPGPPGRGRLRVCRLPGAGALAPRARRGPAVRRVRHLSEVGSHRGRLHQERRPPAARHRHAPVLARLARAASPLHQPRQENCARLLRSSIPESSSSKIEGRTGGNMMKLKYNKLSKTSQILTCKEPLSFVSESPKPVTQNCDL